MSKRIARTLSTVLLAAVLLGAAGCQAALATTTESAFAYPMENVTLTFSSGPESDAPDWMTDTSMAWMDRLQELTGVTLEFTGANFSNLNTEQFLLRIASDDLPDIMWGPDLLKSTATAPAIMIEDGYVLNLSEHMDSLPNFQKALETYPEMAASVMLEDGTLFCFPEFTPDPYPMAGLLIREDWLEELGMALPQTPEQLYEALIAFREEKGATTPITFQSNYLYDSLPAGWGTPGKNWYVEDGQVKHGVLDESFKQFVTDAAQWYAEGLIDPEMPSATKQSVEAAISNGSAGACYNQIYKIENMVTFNVDNPGYKITGIAIGPEEGARPKFGQTVTTVQLGTGLLINPKASNLEAALRFCDFQYTDEGAMLNGYGTEGYSYAIENGEIVEAGILLDSTIPDTNTNKMYAVAKRGNWTGINVGTIYGFIEPAQQAARNWAQTDRALNQLPSVLMLTEQENEAYAQAYADCETLISETVMAFVMGTKSLDQYDAFIDTLHAYGIDRCAAIQQAAYDRYLDVYNGLIR